MSFQVVGNVGEPVIPPELTPSRFAPSRFAPSRLARFRLTLVKIAPAKFASVKLHAFKFFPAAFTSGLNGGPEYQTTGLPNVLSIGSTMDPSVFIYELVDGVIVLISPDPSTLFA